MSEKHTTVESPSAPSADYEGVVRPLRRRLVALLSSVSVARLGAVAAVALVVYFTVVVPADFTLLLVAVLATVGVAAMVPLAAVFVVTRLVE